MLTLDAAKTKTASEQEKERLNKYLAEGVRIMHGQTKSEAEEFAENYSKMRFPEKVSMKTMEEKEASLAKESKKFGTLQKMNYWADADIDNTPFKKVMVGAVGVAIASAMAVSAAYDGPNVFNIGMTAVGSAMAVVEGGKGIVGNIYRSVRQHEKKSAEEYADIKHAQLLLKQVKRELVNPTRQKIELVDLAALRKAQLQR